jgi:hypothetical protein
MDPDSLQPRHVPGLQVGVGDTDLGPSNSRNNQTALVVVKPVVPDLRNIVLAIPYVLADF